METNIILRKATLNDIELLIRLRIDYLTEDIGRLTKAEETAIRKQLSGYFAKHIPNNTFIAIFAELDSVVASTAFLAASEKPASPSFITGVTGTLLNVLTYPKYRRKGIASKVVEAVKKTAIENKWFEPQEVLVFGENGKIIASE